MSAPLLEEYRGNSRLLLVFAPFQEHLFYRELKTLTEVESCRLAERDMLIGWFPAFGLPDLDERLLSVAEVDELYDFYGLDENSFAVILIGKDGGEKYRTSEVPDLGEIFALIDTMPMRQAEMEASPSKCEPAGEQGSEPDSLPQ